MMKIHGGAETNGGKILTALWFTQPERYWDTLRRKWITTKDIGAVCREKAAELYVENPSYVCSCLWQQKLRDAQGASSGTSYTWICGEDYISINGKKINIVSPGQVQPLIDEPVYIDPLLTPVFEYHAGQITEEELKEETGLSGFDISMMNLEARFEGKPIQYALSFIGIILGLMVAIWYLFKGKGI